MTTTSPIEMPHTSAAIWARRLRTLALIVLLAVTGARAMLGEMPFSGPLVQLPAAVSADDGSDPAVVERSDLSRATWPLVILAAAGLWMLAGVLDGQPRGVVGLLALAGGAVFVGWASGSAAGASNRHAAWLVTAEQGTLILAAILAANLARDRRRFMLLVAVLAALGMTLAAKSLYQRFDEIPARIASFEADPQQAFRQMGTTAGTPKAQSLESRIRDTSVTGFGALANMNAAKLLILTSAVAGLAWVKLRIASRTRRRGRRERGEVHPPSLAAGLCGLGLLACVTTLLLTKSKGGVGAAVLVGLFATACWRWRGWASRHWQKLAMGLALAGVLAGAAVVGYGLKHNRLPSKTLTVRWFYWSGGAKLLADHPAWGVGPGNYATWYLHVRDPLAEEEARTPHNVGVHALVQFGWPGGLAYLAMLGGGLVLACRPRRDESMTNEPLAPSTELSLTSRVFAGVCVLAVVAAARWVFALSLPATWLVLIDVFFPAATLAVMLAAAMWFGGAGRETDDADVRRVRLCLAAGCAAFVLHNAVTYSAWTAGPAMVFWVALGAAISQGPISARRMSRVGSTAGVVLVIALGAWVATGLLGPIWRVDRAVHRLARAWPSGQRLDALGAAQQAADANPRDPGVATLAARVGPLIPGSHRPGAEYWARQAVARDPADSNTWRLVGDILHRKAQQGMPGASLGEAVDMFTRAVTLNPVDTRLRMDLGELLLEAGRAAEAYGHLKQAAEFDRQLQGFDVDSHKLLSEAELGRLQNLLLRARLGASAR